MAYEIWGFDTVSSSIRKYREWKGYFSLYKTHNRLLVKGAIRFSSVCFHNTETMKLQD